MKKLYYKYKEVIDYLFWGGVAFFLFMGLFWVFTSVFHWKEVPANVVDNVICIIFTFFTNKFFVFRSKRNSFGEVVKEFVSFVGARIFTMALNALITFIGSDLLGFTTDQQHLPFINDGMIVQLIGQVVVIVTNYVLSKLIIFRKKEKNDPPKEENNSFDDEDGVDI